MKRHFKPFVNQSGLTLVEILVAVTIGLMVMSGVVQLYATSSRTQQVQEGASRLQENARFIFSRLGQDIIQTGFLGCLNLEDADGADALDQKVHIYLADNSGPGEIFDFKEYVRATDNDQLLGSDSLTVRHASSAGRVPLVAESIGTQSLWVDSNHGNYQSLAQYDVVMVANCSSARVFMITNDPTASGGEIQHATGVASPEGQNNTDASLNGSFGYTQLDANTRQYPYGKTVAYLYPVGGTSTLYSIRTSAAAAATGGACSVATPEFCSLFIGDNDEIAQGVEDLQVQIGWLDNTGNTRLTDVDPGFTDWARVDRINVEITLNTINEVPNNQGRSLERQTFSKTFMLRNQLR